MLNQTKSFLGLTPMFTDTLATRHTTCELCAVRADESFKSNPRPGRNQSKTDILADNMRSSAAILILAMFAKTQGSPFPEPEADPGYRVIKTVQIWDDDKDVDSLGDAELDVNDLFDLDDYVDGLEPEERTLIGYVDDDGNLHPDHHHHVEEEGRPDLFREDVDTKVLVTDQFLNNPDVTVDSNGLKCIRKLMQIEYTDYTEVMTCVHKTEERCHTSYVTNFEGHQEEKCDEKFEKTCTIYYENVAVNEEVEVCKTYLCPDCSREGPEECQTVYDTVCETKRKVHNVLDDVVNCNTVQEEKCEQVLDGE